MFILSICMAGWWFQPTPLKNDGVKVSWDNQIPFPTVKLESHSSNSMVPKHQPDILLFQ